jgi:uncharacterized protein
MLEPILSRITIYPVKSLDGVSLQKAVISEGGCLLHDREYVISDEAGNFINGKKNPLVHALRTSIDLENETISFQHPNQTSAISFHLQEEKIAIQDFLSTYFRKKVLLHQNKTGRFLDIPDRSGATILSTASLQEVANWFGNMPLEETRKRFRATLEIESVPAFWEDQLFASIGKGIELKIGDVTMIGMSPRARCIVPTRHPENGAVIQAFQKSFSHQRSNKLPEWSALGQYDHYYHLSVDCFIPATEIGKTFEVGYGLTIIKEIEIA